MVESSIRMDSQKEQGGISEIIESRESEAIGNNDMLVENLESAGVVDEEREESNNEEVVVSVLEETFEKNMPGVDKQLESLIESEQHVVTMPKDTGSGREVFFGCLHLECRNSQSREPCEHGSEWRIYSTHGTVSRSEVEKDNLEGVAGVSLENRNFLKVELGGCQYQALYDSGATLSLVNANIARKFQGRLETVDIRVETAMGTTAKCLGELKMYLAIDGITDVLKFKAMENIKHDIILGMDFIEK